MLAVFTKEIRNGIRIEIAAHAGRAAQAEDVHAGVGLAVHVRMRLVAGVGLVARIHVEQRVAHLLHEERFFRRLRIAIAELALTVEGELGAAVGREQPHLLARQQGRGVEQIAQRERSATALQVEMQLDFDRDGRQRDRAGLGAGRGRVGQAVEEIQFIAHLVRFEDRAAGHGLLFGVGLGGHRESPVGFAIDLHVHYVHRRKMPFLSNPATSRASTDCTARPTANG